MRQQRTKDCPLWIKLPVNSGNLIRTFMLNATSK